MELLTCKLEASSRLVGVADDGFESILGVALREGCAFREVGISVVGARRRPVLALSLWSTEDSVGGVSRQFDAGLLVLLSRGQIPIEADSGRSDMSSGYAELLDDKVVAHCILFVVEPWLCKR
jgi:hypothetical protein